MTTSTLAQRFSLPNMPFNREINNGCPVGSIIRLTGKSYPDLNKFIHLRLITNNNDVALRVSLQLENPSQLKIDCLIGQKSSTSVDSPIVINSNQTFALLIQTLQHSFQILYNGSKIADFVHRVDPILIKKISIDGPLICEEVLIDHPSNLPTYQQATSPPTDLLKNMSLDEKRNVPNPANSFDFPPPPPNILTGSSNVPTTTGASFNYAGNSQGFSNHPYPLPGLIDNNTYPSQQNSANRLPTTNSSVPQPSEQPVPITVNTGITSQQTSAANPPYPLSNSGIQQPQPSVLSPQTPQPYTVTLPPTVPNTPVQQTPIHPNQPIYQNQMQNYPLNMVPPSVQPQMFSPPPPVAPPLPQQAVQVQQFAPPMQVQPTYGYPPVPYVQGYVPPPQPMYQPYQAGYYPGVVYYEADYYPHHHHHHRHHHHCD